MTYLERQEFLKQFNFLGDIIASMILNDWDRKFLKGAELFEALKKTTSDYVIMKKIDETQASTIVKEFASKIGINVDSKELEVKKEETEKIDYFKLDWNIWKELNNKEKNDAKPLEKPDPAFKEFEKRVPSSIRTNYSFKKLFTYNISEREVTEINKTFFDMFEWPLSPVHNKNLEVVNTKKLKMMEHSNDPEGLCEERIKFMAEHRFILTTPKINTFAQLTRVVSMDNITQEVIEQMREWKNQKGYTINEAINEVVTPQLIAVHPFIDFDFKFDNEDEKTDEQKMTKIDSVFAWLEQLKEHVFGNYCVGGYTKEPHIAKKYFGDDYKLYEGEGKRLSLHVIFYEKAMLISDLIELFKKENNEFIYTKNMNPSVDHKVYEVQQRRLFRHTLSPKLQAKNENLMYNGRFLKGYEPPRFEDSFVSLTGIETPVKQSDLKEFFDFDHSKPKSKMPKKPTKTLPITLADEPTKKTVKEHSMKQAKEKSQNALHEESTEASTEASQEEFHETHYGDYQENKIKVTLPKEYMRSLLDMIPWHRYGDFMYTGGDPLHAALSTFIANSPYSYDDTLELLNSWWLREEHHRHDDEMEKMLKSEYYKDGIHEQHNNTYFYCFYKYATSLIPRVETIEVKYCEKYNIKIAVFKLYKDELNNKYLAAKKNKNLSRDYYPYIKKLEAAAAQIENLPIAPRQSIETIQDNFLDLVNSDKAEQPQQSESQQSESQYDWLPEIMKIVYPSGDSRSAPSGDSKKPKIGDSTKFKFHVTMFKLQQLMKAEIDVAKSKREPLEKIKCEFGKRVMALNGPDTDKCYKRSRYNNFYDESTKKLVTMTYDSRRDPIIPTTEKILKDFYTDEQIDVSRYWHTSLRELEILKKEQRLLQLYAVSDSDPRTDNARRFIEIIKKTFRRPIDSKAYFEFLRKKLENPDKKLDYNLCCYGASGVFKTALINIVSIFINTKILSMKDVENQFNDWIIGTSLAVVEEIAQQEERAAEKAEALKRNLNHVVNIQVKHGPSFDVESSMDMIMNCNFASIGGLMDYRETNDMARRFILMPRIRPDNWDEDLEWGCKYIAERDNWKFIAGMILREEYLTDDEREELLKYQKDEEQARFKTMAGKRGVLGYDVLTSFLIYNDVTTARKKKLRKNSYCLNVDSLSQELKKNTSYNAGGQTEKAFLLSIGVLDNQAQKYNYIVDIVKFYFTYISLTSPRATQFLLNKLKENYPGCEETETYKNELKSWLEETGVESLNDEINENPEVNNDFETYE